MSDECGKSSSSLVGEDGSSSESVISLALFAKKEIHSVAFVFVCGGWGGGNWCGEMLTSFSFFFLI
jgi:hypothetical protein